VNISTPGVAVGQPQPHLMGQPGVDAVSRQVADGGKEVHAAVPTLMPEGERFGSGGAAVFRPDIPCHNADVRQNRRGSQDDRHVPLKHCFASSPCFA